MKPTLILFLILTTLHSCKTTGVEESAKELTNTKLWTAEDRAFILDELARTTNALKLETEYLTEEQASFRLNEKAWSITEIIEHLEVQNELHFREIRAIAKTPQLLEYVAIVKSNDNYFQSYATDTVKGKSQWFLEPLGRFGTKTAALEAFLRVRHHFTEFLANTDIDLRKHFTFRRQLEFVDAHNFKLGDVRDLHQLLLTGIAHTDRHLTQIKRIKQDENFPN
jgi:hypothetical protein